MSQWIETSDGYWLREGGFYAIEKDSDGRFRLIEDVDGFCEMEVADAPTFDEMVKWADEWIAMQDGDAL